MSTQDSTQRPRTNRQKTKIDDVRDASAGWRAEYRHQHVEGDSGAEHLHDVTETAAEKAARGTREQVRGGGQG